jgi:hypothetical protein
LSADHILILLKKKLLRKENKINSKYREILNLFSSSLKEKKGQFNKINVYIILKGNIFVKYGYFMLLKIKQCILKRKYPM